MVELVALVKCLGVHSSGKGKYHVQEGNKNLSHHPVTSALLCVPHRAPQGNG